MLRAKELRARAAVKFCATREQEQRPTRGKRNCQETRRDQEIIHGCSASSVATEFMPALLGRAGAKNHHSKSGGAKSWQFRAAESQGERTECSGEGCLPTCLINLGDTGLPKSSNKLCPITERERGEFCTLFKSHFTSKVMSF